MRAITLLLTISVSAMVIGCDSDTFSQARTQDVAISPTPVVVPKVPPNLNFAGEAVPLEDPDVYERMDRELTTNSYYHSSTLSVIKKANRWEATIKRILKEEGVPEDFFYLACAESGLDHKSLSIAGAKGIWQFLDDTAKEYGLEVSSTVDERYDPILSTHAAARYLKRAYERFGTWSMVAAAYNRGMTGMQKAISGQQVTSYYDLFLNPETYRYVFRILALKTILQEPEKYGFIVDRDQLYPEWEFKEIKVSESIADLPRFALDNGTNYKTLKVLNPWMDPDAEYQLKAWPGKTYTVRLPK